MKSQKILKRENHYVPQWYQKGFTKNKSSLIYHLELNKTVTNSNGDVIKINKSYKRSVDKIFRIKDLYTTSFGAILIDEIEDKFFGKIDATGSKAIRAFIENKPEYIHKRFQDFFDFIDIQKLRTPKGLDWIKQQYSYLDKNSLLIEMQALNKQYITIWTEGVREIISAKKSNTKFIFSDHPVTTYNYAIPLSNIQNTYPNDPLITSNATQTIFPLNQDFCLILTNYEYADNEDINPLDKRTNSDPYHDSIVHTLNMIRERELTENEVREINYIIKQKAVNYIAGNDKDCLFPEKYVTKEWHEFKNLLLPPHTNHFGGEMYVGYDDGTTLYQDAFGRSTPQNKYLIKNLDEHKLQPNNECGCGSGKKYKYCCKGKSHKLRPSWKELSIRERNIILYNAIIDIVGLTNGKTWDDVRRELNTDQVKEIYQVYDSLWSLDTNIIDLLPKADNSIRTLYTGVVDAENIETLIVNLTMYFDEVIIQNPLIHPSRMTDEFNPIKNPKKYLQQTLKYIFFMIKVYPFIEDGSILLLPNITDFNKHIYKSSMNMSQTRFNELPSTIHPKDTSILKQQEKNLINSYMGLPEYQIKNFLKSINSKLEDKELEKMMTVFKQAALTDPLVLLQDNIFIDGGQLQLMSFSPTLEISFFLSQITGAILVTDSYTRWEEIKKHQMKELSLTTYRYLTLTKLINTYNFTFHQNTEFTLHDKDTINLKNIRKLFHEIYSLVYFNTTESKNTIKNLKSKFKKEHLKYLSNLKKTNFGDYKCSFHLLIPNGGFLSRDVQRLLIQSGSDTHLMNVPMAIFISTEIE